MFARETEPSGRPQALRVLLIEHDEAFSRSISGMLDQARDAIGGVVVAPSLQEAIQSIREEQFAVILLEFFLPDGAGLANIAVLHEVAPQVPIIVVGAVDDEALAIEAVHAGAQDYLVKNQINPNWLLRSIRYTVERHEADQAVIRAEEKYHGIFDHLMEGIFQTTPDGRYRLANQALARIYGYANPDELMDSVTDIGRRLYVMPGRREEFMRVMEERDTISDFESQIFRKDGSIIWISENCRAIRDAAGRLLYYEGTVEDITHRRQAADELRNSESLYHSLVETMPQNVFRKSLEGRFTFANRQYCRHYNCKLADILGKTDFDFFPKELAEKYKADDLRVMATGETLEIVEEHHPFGQRKGVTHVVKTPLYGPDGTIIGLQGMFWDITEQKLAEERVRQAQESLRESEALYHSLVDTMPQCIFRKDLQGRYTFANKQFCRVVGRPAEEIIGKTIFDIYPQKLAEKRQSDDQRVLTTGRTIEQIEENRFPGRENEFLHVIKMPIRDINGNITGLQGMFWDITAQKLAEQRIKKAHSDLAASREELRVKHEQMEEDLKMAREIQVAMLPQQYPVLPRGESAEDSAFRFTHRYQPSGTVGGDFFSVAPLSDIEVAVFICDVAGHGVRSALITAMVRALVEELRTLAHDPGQFMTKLNTELFAILKHAGSPVLTTAFYLVANSATGEMRYANAGHPKPLLLRRSEDRIEPLRNVTKQNQPALGLFETAAYASSEVKLLPGNLIMLYTDGLYEVHSAQDELFTQDMLAKAAHQHLQLPAAALFDALLADIRQFAAQGRFDDDVCLVGMEFDGSARAKVR
jgi:sigma-B regulation protein RsbU (phosphoserine phosphatase)